MKSYVSKFFYQKNDKDNGRWRELLVMNETTDKVEGFDLTYLSKNERKAAIKLLCQKHNVHNWISSRPSQSTHNITGLDVNWFKGWRVFMKDKIDDNVYTLSSFADMVIQNNFSRSNISKNVKSNIYKAFKKSSIPTVYGITVTNISNNSKKFSGIRVIEIKA